MTSSFTTNGKPVSSTSYAWTGTTNASSSTERIDGAITRTNYITNGGVRVSTAGWVTRGGTETNNDVTIARAESAAFASGFGWSVTGSSTSSYLNVEGGAPVSLSVVPGLTYTASMRAFVTGSARAVKLRFRWGGGVGDQFSARVLVTPGEFPMLSISAVAPPSATSLTVTMLYDDQTPFGPNDSVVLGDALLEASQTIGTFFDGSFPAVIVYPTALPRVVDGYTHSRDSRHSFNTVPGAAESYVVAFPGSLRNGSMTAVFDSFDAAAMLDRMLAGVEPIIFSDSDYPQLGMTFMVNGRSSLQQDAERQAWLVSFDFQEVTP